MEKILLSQLLQGIASPGQDCYIDNVVYDSRQVSGSTLFVAIKGDKVNGQDFAPRAVQNGAEFVLTEDYIPTVPGNMQAVVPSVLDANIAMRKNYRDRYDIDVIGVTGSVGKTTTKDFIYAAISPFAKTVRSQGNRNNELGLPRTVFGITSSDRYAVLEMGMENLGDIKKLTKATRPVAACITGIGISHLERLGSRENIFRAKMEICEGMGPGGVLSLNADDDFLPSAKPANSVKPVYFGIDSNLCEVKAENMEISGTGTKFVIDDRGMGIKIPRQIPAVGKHNVRDALCAYTVVSRLGFDPVKTAGNLAGYRPSGMRENFVRKNGVLFIEDCYNAAPSSMMAALDTLSTVAEGRKIAVLGDMLELGPDAEKLHRQVGEYAAHKGVDIMMTYGTLAQAIAEGFGPGRGIFDTKESLAEKLTEVLSPGDTVIFKASHSMRFEDIIRLVYEKWEKLC